MLTLVSASAGRLHLPLPRRPGPHVHRESLNERYASVTETGLSNTCDTRFKGKQKPLSIVIMERRSVSYQPLNPAPIIKVLGCCRCDVVMCERGINKVRHGYESSINWERRRRRSQDEMRRRTDHREMGWTAGE